METKAPRENPQQHRKKIHTVHTYKSAELHSHLKTLLFESSVTRLLNKKNMNRCVTLSANNVRVTM